MVGSDSGDSDAVTKPGGEWYEVCAYCGEAIDFSRAAIALGTGEASYEPFMEDWRGGYVKVAHPKCFAEAEGIEAFLAAVARNDARQRGQPLARLTFTRDQARFLGLYVAGIDGAASVDIGERMGVFDLAVYDKTGERIAGRSLGRGDSEL